MAISLNNHETRIKALENMTNKLTCVTISTDKIQVNGSWKRILTASQIESYDWILTNNSASSGWVSSATDSRKCNIMNLVNLSVLRANRNSPMIFQTLTNAYGNYYEHDQFYIDSVGDLFTCVWQGSGSPTDNFIFRIFGLKLYYSFSYNIIYKILLRKISRLYQIFTLLKQKECEIKWL